ncbi:MAG: L-histidine N(alpha)-methyltransferase [Pseudomonadales bacterium]|nr:L-histidine N(alpha)-methyltransferase [Pseudomonadales bacterium]
MQALRKFSEEVHEGLSKSPKQLPSKYFYNAKGDALFQQIMSMPEYYLTRAELEIFQTQSAAIIEALRLKPYRHFELVELGAGDGTKTVELLQALQRKEYRFDYMPIDISANALALLEASILQAVPGLSLQKQQGDYFELLGNLKNSTHPKVVLFLGSNIGNMRDAQAKTFLEKLASNLNAGDALLLGVDLIKSADVVLPAYNDKRGITRAFNLNLLQRINDDLDADFCLKSFEHTPEYCEDVGVAKSYLASTKDQVVTIKHLGEQYTFEEGEKIHTEISRKYDDAVINEIIEGSGLQIHTRFTDTDALFADYILIKQ